MTDRPKPGEFELIRRHFAPLATSPGAFQLSDDAAVLPAPQGQDLVFTADALIAGVHFLATDPPDLVARKLIRVNLSDLAAMGARALGYLLTAAWPPSADEDWIAGFASGLAVDQKQFDIALLGGDTVSTSGSIALSLTAIGAVAEGAALRRSGARVGDRLFLTGSLGDGALGLLAARGELSGADADDITYLQGRYRLPEPRTSVGPRLVALASAAIDVSDGLVADAGHLAETSGVTVRVERSALPLSPAAARRVHAAPQHWSLVLGGGDDYELLFSAPPSARGQIAEIAVETGVPIAEIGAIAEGEGVCVLAEDGSPVKLPEAGWQHF